MRIVHTLTDIPKGRWVLGMGFFDGFHRGHQEIAAAVLALAREKEAQPGILTFFPHPASILYPERVIELLQTEAEKEQYLAAAGMVLSVILLPTKALLAKSADDFLSELSGVPGLTGIVCGENFTFGQGAQGNPAQMETFFQHTGIAVKTMPLMRSDDIDGRVISSTEIRRLLRKGDVTAASHLLGRVYSLSGDVVHGFRRGTEAIGFPTANLSFGKDRVLPADGVYATYANIRGHRYPAVTNIGKNPTFDNQERTIETFIFHFDDHIYGEPFSVEFVKRLRGETKFESVEALKQQIALDIGQAKDILAQRM